MWKTYKIRSWAFVKKINVLFSSLREQAFRGCSKLLYPNKKQYVKFEGYQPTNVVDLRNYYEMYFTRYEW